MNESLTTSDVLTLLIALYGAVLSTVLALKELRKDKRQVKVTCRMALAPSPVGDVWEFISVEAVNTGHRPVEITMAGLLMKNGDLFTQVVSKAGRNPLPKKIEDGERVTVLFDYPELKKALGEQRDPENRLTKAVVHDAEGNKYTSKLPKVLRGKDAVK
jgi:hypothetical protein